MASGGVVSERGPEKAYDVEQLFGLFYNGGNRRTLTDVVDIAAKLETPIDVSYSTLRRYSDEYDWSNRADALDAEARKIADKRLANLVGRHRAREVEALATLSTKFFRRLIPSTRENPNPFEIQPGDIEIDDFIAIAKTFELLTGGATTRVGDEGPSALEEMARAITALDEADDLPALTAGDRG